MMMMAYQSDDNCCCCYLQNRPLAWCTRWWRCPPLDFSTPTRNTEPCAPTCGNKNLMLRNTANSPNTQIQILQIYKYKYCKYTNTITPTHNTEPMHPPAEIENWKLRKTIVILPVRSSRMSNEISGPNRKKIQNWSISLETCLWLFHGRLLQIPNGDN